MADYTFDTSGDLSEAFKIKPVEEQTQEMITPSAEETEARHEREAQERAGVQQLLHSGPCAADPADLRDPRPHQARCRR